MNLNPQQRAAAHDVDRHVLVSAGAGTGKTQCVVARVLYALGEPVAGRQVAPERHLKLRDIAAITFTNLAAADLQRKLRCALRDTGREIDARQVDTARIGTIHAFCGHVMREFALQLGRSPGVLLLDEAESVALAAECAREALLTTLETGGEPGLDALLGGYSADDVQRYAARLAADADRLALILADDRMDPRERALANLAGRTLERMRHRLDERSALDFDAMITQVRDLLRERQDVRRVLQRRIRMLIVDEFQDVDPAQREIAYLLGEPETRRADTTRLMLVGDAKQSIFRFRRADVTVWTRVRHDFDDQGLGAVHVLTENFRSRRPILGFVDATIGAALDAAGAGGARADYEVAFEPLTACPANDTTDSCVEVLTLPRDERGKALSGATARAFEIPALAVRVRALVDAGTPPGDIAVLLPAWAPTGAVRAALLAAGVSSWTLRNEGYFERREVLDCLVALHAMLDPLDDVSLFGFLRSPMVGVRDETLLAIARHVKAPYGRRLMEAPTGEPELLAFGAALVDRYARLRDRLPHDELLDGLLDETGYMAHLVLLGEDGRQAQANVRKLVRLLRAWRHHTLRDLLKMVAEFRERDEGKREGDAPLAARDDAVTITSIHSAKGLEWPVVVWADLTRGAHGPGEKCLIGRSAMRLRDPDIEEAGEDARFQALKGAEELEEQAQRHRVWYVAATRARNRLIVSGVPAGELSGRHRGTAARLCVERLGAPIGDTAAYHDHVGAAFTARVVPARAAPDAGTHPAEPLPVLAASTIPLSPPVVVVRGGRPRHSASELLTFSKCARKHWFQYVAGLREPPVDRQSAEFLDAVTRGHIVHDVLEHLRERDELDGLLEDAIGRWDPDAPPPEAPEGLRYRGVLREEVTGVVSHADYRVVAALPGARHELPFVHLLSAPRWMQGRVDLVGERGDGLVVVDVKTGGQDTEDAARRKAAAYQPQREVYVSALEAVAGRPVAEFAFHFSRAGIHVAEALTPELRAEGAAAVGTTLERIEAGDRALTANPHECRFCGFRAAGWCAGVRFD